MTIAKLGDFGSAIVCNFMSGTPATRTYTLASAVPVGSTVMMFGHMQGQVGSGPVVLSVTDTKNNPWTIRYAPPETPGIFLADCCRIPTALAVNDVITVVRRSADGVYAITGAWFTGCNYDKQADATWPAGSTAAKGGQLTPSIASELVIGIFGQMARWSATPPAITAGAGYTAVIGATRSSSGPEGDESVACRWEYKIAGAPVLEQATATMNAGPDAPNVGSGMTVAYSEFDLSNNLMAIA